MALIGKKAGCRDELTVQDFNFMTRKDTRRYERLKVRWQWEGHWEVAGIESCIGGGIKQRGACVAN